MSDKSSSSSSGNGKGKKKWWLAGLGDSEETFRQLATELKGEFIPKALLRTAGVRTRAGNWTIQCNAIDDGTGNQVRALFLNRSGLTFRIFRETGAQRFAKRLGMSDIQVGRKYLDEKYVIQSNDPVKLSALLDDDLIEELLLRVPTGSWSVLRREPTNLRRYPKGVDLLYFNHPRAEGEYETMRSAFVLHVLLLKRMVELEIAFAGDPRVKLK